MLPFTTIENEMVIEVTDRAKEAFSESRLKIRKRILAVFVELAGHLKRGRTECF
jgi:hypothetical protein